MKKLQMNLLKDALGKYEIGCIENFVRGKTKEVWWHVIKNIKHKIKHILSKLRKKSISFSFKLKMYNFHYADGKTFF